MGLFSGSELTLTWLSVPYGFTVDIRGRYGVRAWHGFLPHFILQPCICTLYLVQPSTAEVYI